MPSRDIVVVGASAGGVEALQSFARTLPQKFPAAVFVTLHVPPRHTSVLPRILARAGALPAIHAADGDAIIPGRIYVAPPDHHLFITPGAVRLIRGPHENGNRPAVDPMFRSAAVAFGPRVIGVVLSGALDDGTAGLAAIKRNGGLAVVQNPDEAMFPSMPQSALDHVKIDRVTTIRHLAETLLELIHLPMPAREFHASKDDRMENELSAGDLETIGHPEKHPGTVSPYSCPDCGGVLWEIRDGDFIRFRCRVGHAWTGHGLLAQQSTVFDDALWVALRSLEESAALSRQIAARHQARGAESLAQRFEAQAESQEARAQVIRAAIAAEAGVPPDAVPADEAS